jgi:hypothetical protein
MTDLEYQRIKQYNYDHSPKGSIARARARKKLINTRRILIQKVKNRPCADCLDWFNPWQMDFDHRPGTNKIKAVGLLAHTASMERVLVEMAKCDLVCSNCHRNRTYRRKHENHMPQWSK